MKKIDVGYFEPGVDSDVLIRGLNYYKDDKILDIWASGDVVKAYVKGEEIYRIELKVQDAIIEYCKCTCPYYEEEENICKHITAVLFYLKNHEVPELENIKKD